jgi:hypothetical protein
MAKVKIQGHASGTGVLTVTAPNTSTDRTITLPDATCTLADNSDVTNKLPLAGGTMTAPLRINHASSAQSTTIRANATNSDGYFAVGNSDLSDFILLYGGHSGNDNSTLGFKSDNNLRFATYSDTTGTYVAQQLLITNDGRGLSQFTAKAWLNMNGTGTIAIRDSHNVSSVTDVGTGDYRINYSNAMANTSYCPTIGNTADNPLGNGDNRYILVVTSISTGYLDVVSTIVANGFSKVDKSHCLVTVFGD